MPREGSGGVVQWGRGWAPQIVDIGVLRGCSIFAVLLWGVATSRKPKIFFEPKWG